MRWRRLNARESIDEGCKVPSVKATSDARYSTQGDQEVNEKLFGLTSDLAQVNPIMSWDRR